MQSSKRFWRGLFFIFLITALCGGMALPSMDFSARAAPQMQTALDIVISEFRTRGPSGGNDEFIELYNPTSNPVDISGWKINGSNATGSTTTRVTIPSSIVLYPGHYFLVVNNANGGYSNVSIPPNLTYRSGITDDGGIALLRADNSIADQVGMSSGSVYKEGGILAPLSGTSDQSYERKLGGSSNSCEDTDDNISDFQLITPSGPQNLSSNPGLCGVSLPTLTPTPTHTPSSTPTITNTPTNTLDPATAAVLTSTASAVNATGTSLALTSAASDSVVISEFRPTGPDGGNDEFVELYNRSGSPVSIGGWEVRKSSCSGGDSHVTYITAGVTLMSGQHYLIGGNKYSGSVTPDQPNTPLSIANDGGVALLNGSTIVDQVGMCATTLYQEGTALAPLTSNTNRSYDRKPSSGGICSDTNNNTADFLLRGPSDPQNFASNLTACGNPTLTPTVTQTATPTRTPSRTRTPTRTRTPSRTPSPRPPPPLIAINEFVPRPGHDWNGDGVVNVGDEFIELLNHGVIDVNLSGYALDDEVNIGSAPYRLPSITLKPGERRVFYGSETGLLLSDGGDGVRLIKPNGQLGDAYNYRVVRFPDQSYCRLPDNGGLDDWNQNCFPTPGLQNSLASSVNPPSAGDAASLCPISDTLPNDFMLAECPPFGNNIWNPEYWDRNGWFDEKFLPESPPGKWNVFVD